ncbi:MAG: hypothetical protein ACJZ42_02185 [Candidatus Thalassarchaeaceae archaeon]|nr:MAG: hypothetical protein CND84_03315 [Marine Group II euryarchaeote MED-G35]
MSPKEDDTIVDKVIGNPAFDQMFGYHIFFRRAAIPVLLFLIGLLAYTIFDSFLSSQNTLTLSFVIVGLSLGPILNLERYMGSILSKK